MTDWCGRILPGMALLLLLAPMPATWAETIGQVKAVSGDVVLIRGEARTPATAGALIEKADTVATGVDGRVGITFIDNSRFSVGPNSRVAFAKFVFNPTTREGAFLTKVDRGAISVISGHIAHSDPDAMQVQTPTTILGVRGTRFLVQINE